MSNENRGEEPLAVAKHGSETLLVVEDEEHLLRVVSGVLSRCGYNVLGANRAAEAMLLSEQHAGDIHLLLSSTGMPLLQQLTDRLRSTRPGMKVVLILKPFSTSTLVQKIREALGS